MNAPAEGRATPPRVVMLAHVFPRQASDPLGAFLLHLVDAFGARAEVSVIAPHAPGLAFEEKLGRAEVKRFRYAPDAWETLAYTGVMHEQVRRGARAKFVFGMFVAADMWAALRQVRATRGSLIHAHWWLPGGLVGAMVSKITGAPLVLTTHGTDVEQLRKAGWATPLARFAFGQARAITCGSKDQREQLLALGVIEPTRVHVIPMPVNPIFVRAERKTKTSDGTLKVLTVARLTTQKSIDTLIEAVAQVRARGIDARLRIAGDGVERAGLEQQTRALGLEGKVEFLGMQPQTELPRLYAECDVFVLPSVREGMGLVLAEALLGGAPVIATDSGGVTDLVRDGETGLLFPERDAGALADALERVAREPEWAARLAAKGRAVALERFAPERVAGEFLRVYGA